MWLFIVQGTVLSADEICQYLTVIDLKQWVMIYQQIEYYIVLVVTAALCVKLFQSSRLNLKSFYVFTFSTMSCCFCLENAAKGRSWQKLEIFQSLLAGSQGQVFESSASGKKAVWSTVILILWLSGELEGNLTWGIIAWVIIRKCENETSLDWLKSRKTVVWLLATNGSFAAEQSHGTKLAKWRGNDALGHIKLRKLKFGCFV